MAEPSFWETAFTEAQELLQTESDGFAAVLNTIAGFDVLSNCGTAINVFEAAGTALLTCFSVWKHLHTAPTSTFTAVSKVRYELQ